MGNALSLIVERFGPIGRVEVPFGDITVLVGPQATGKSLVLQWLKLAVDPNRVLGTLGSHGLEVAGDEQRLLGWFFGAGYKDSSAGRLRVSLGGRKVGLADLARGRLRYEPHHALYIPAHRTLVMGTGWPLTFRSFDEDTPFVVRDFSERVRELLSLRDEGVLFPAPRRFRAEFRDSLDAALFHGGKVVVESKGLGGKQLRLVHGKTKLSIMEWTTGQREVVPLVVGLYDALPAGKIERRPPLEWVIVEEPELGLHPNGVLAVLVLLLEVARRGYRLVLSTHSPLILDVLWAMQHLKGERGGASRLLDILKVRETQFTSGFAKSVLEKEQRVVYLDFRNGRVVSTDITGLDPLSEDEAERGWGGLLGHSTAIANAVAERP